MVRRPALGREADELGDADAVGPAFCVDDEEGAAFLFAGVWLAAPPPDALGPAFCVDEDEGAASLSAGVWLAAAPPDAFEAGLAPGLVAAPRTTALRRASAAAASPSDWLKPGGGESKHRAAMVNAAVV